MFRIQENGIGITVGVEFVDRECGVSEDDVRTVFLNSIDNDQKIAGSIYELDTDYLQETSIEGECHSAVKINKIVHYINKIMAFTS